MDRDRNLHNIYMYICMYVYIYICILAVYVIDFYFVICQLHDV